MSNIYDVVWHGEYIGKMEFDGSALELQAFLEELDDLPRDMLFHHAKQKTAEREAFLYHEGKMLEGNILYDSHHRSEI